MANYWYIDILLPVTIYITNSKVTIILMRMGKLVILSLE
jgi:hypothetical protein